MTNKQIFSIKMRSIFLVILYILLVVPVLYIGSYNYHSADDFGFSAASHIAWEETHSIGKVISAAIATVVDRWYTWQGPFTTTFFVSLEPGIFGEEFYHVVPFIMIGILTTSSLYFFHVVIVQIIGCSKNIWISMTMIYLVYILECLPSPVEGFFWYCGAFVYIVPHSMAMILTGWLISIFFKRESIYLLITSCILAFFIGGTNYITALETVEGLVLGLICSFLYKRKDIFQKLLIVFFSIIPGFMLNVLAPGNSVRQSEFENHPGAIKAVFLSFYYCLNQAFGEWFNWTTIVLVLSALPIIFICVQALKDRVTFKYPLVILGISFCFLASLYAPSTYATGKLGSGRVNNIIFFQYILILLFNIGYILGWINSKFEISNSMINSDRRGDNIFFCMLFSFIIFASALQVIKEPNSFTTSSAIISLINGEAKTYGEENELRYRQILESKDAVLYLPRFTVMPYLLYMDDIVPDSSDWRNNSMERYYRKKEIVAYSIEDRSQDK